jgi:hypothetical protein
LFVRTRQGTLPGNGGVRLSLLLQLEFFHNLVQGMVIFLVYTILSFGFFSSFLFFPSRNHLSSYTERTTPFLWWRVFRTVASSGRQHTKRRGGDGALLTICVS